VAFKSFPLIKIFLVIITLSLVTAVGYNIYQYNQNKKLAAEREKNTATIQQISQELNNLKNEDQYKTNIALKKKIDETQKTFSQSVVVYESLLDLENPPKNIKNLDSLFANVLTQLGKQDYETASKSLTDLSTKIKDEQAKIAASATIPKNVPANNTSPSGGYSRQKVTTENGEFLVDLVAGDLSSTKVIVDTASESTCANDCPILPLATYVTRSGAYAGINGSYYCPASYPSCAGKINSFDLLVMNKNKVYFNSDNNIYSTNPAVVFGGSYIKFVTAAQEIGRDTNIDGVLSNFPLLVFNSNIMFNGDSDPKKSSKSSRSFVANKGNVVYIGVVHNATVADSAKVLKSLGMENGMNLDGGGSTALWSGGYKVGPGRDLANVILFVKK
jgi:hypothetical protein